MLGVYNFLTKHGQVVAFGLGLLITLAFYGMVGGGIEEFNLVEEKLRPKAPEGEIFTPGIAITVWLARLAALLIIGFGIYHVVQNPKGALKGIIGLVVLAVIFGIAYSMSAGEILDTWNTEDEITSGISKYVDGAITTTGVLIGLALLAFIYSEIRNFFK